AFVGASDVCLVLLKKTDLFKTVIPTKMLEFMSCAKPVILGVDGQARQIVEGARAGPVIEPENANALVDAIQRLKADASACRTFGQSARAYIVEHYSREQTAGQYVGVLNDVLGKQGESPWRRTARDST